MQIDLAFKNYRCFSSVNPIRLTLGTGFFAFVGINNAGKSSLLKFFYEMRPLFKDLQSVNQLQNLCLGSYLQVQKVPEVSDVEDLFFNGNQEDICVDIELQELPPDAQGREEVIRASFVANRNSKTWKCRFFTATREITPKVVGNVNLNWNGFEFIANGRHIAFFNLFIEACSSLSAAYYVPSFRHITSFSPTAGGPNSYYDTSVGRPFIEMWHNLQSGDSRKDRGRVHRLVEEIKDIFDFEELQINPSVSKNTLQLSINDQPFNLQELGAGLAQFILVLGNAAFRDSSWILIDEPELSLHPSLQVKFLMRLGSYASKGVFFATHNIGLARSVAEEIYSVTRAKADTQVKELGQNPTLAELLGELNYEGYRPLGFSKLLLVEGRTSFKVFLEFLRILNKDHEFLIVPMSDLITHNSREELQEVTRICPAVFAVIDSEKQGAASVLSANIQGFAQNSDALGILCHITQHRAIENYLSDRAVKAEMGPAYRALTPYEGRQGLQLWNKKDNWKIARRMERAELEATDLGQFLAAI